jgi:hypothetical protein
MLFLVPNPSAELLLREELERRHLPRHPPCVVGELPPALSEGRRLIDEYVRTQIFSVGSLETSPHFGTLRGSAEWSQALNTCFVAPQSDPHVSWANLASVVFGHMRDMTPTEHESFNAAVRPYGKVVRRVDLSSWD